MTEVRGVERLVGRHRGVRLDPGALPDRGPDSQHAGARRCITGLYVADGAVVPTSPGVNLLLTISALVERAMMLLIRDRGRTAK